MLGGDHIKKQSNRGGKIETLKKIGEIFFFEDTLKSLTTLMEQVLPLLQPILNPEWRL